MIYRSWLSENGPHADSTKLLASASFINSTFGAEYKCGDSGHYSDKMDGIAAQIMGCSRQFIYTHLKLAEYTHDGICHVTQFRREQIQYHPERTGTGEAPLALARTIKRQWGDFQDCPDTQLAMQLRDCVRTWLGAKWERKLLVTIEANRRPDIRALKSPNLDVFQDLVALTKMQQTRVQAL
jgi:hypothetical protein